jgi:hypothetical protein
MKHAFRPWPFMSPLSRREGDYELRDEDEELSESPFCGCDLQPMVCELDASRCACCGKALP